MQSWSITSRVKKLLTKLLAKAGFGIYRIDARQANLYFHYGVSHVLDVGANTGQYGKWLRDHVRYTGEIISFEPLHDAFQLLEAVAKKDPNWRAVNCGLGDKPGTLDINISDNSVSSSFLPMAQACESAAPDSRYVSHQVAKVETLDNVFHQYCVNPASVYLKIDTQGFEKQVLDGAATVLPLVDTVELELSLTTLYEGQVLFREMHEFMCDRGYELVSLEPEFWDPNTGVLLQVNGIFHRP
jgi:FkbM family methyltransferase